MLVFTACGYQCPVEPCTYRLAPHSGDVKKQKLEKDTAGHLLHLDVDPETREVLILDHWQMHYSPISTVASVKASCTFYDAAGKGCASWLCPRAYVLKRHLMDIHSMDADLSERSAKVRKNMPKRPDFLPITKDELMSALTPRLAVRNSIIANTLLSQRMRPPRLALLFPEGTQIKRRTGQ